MSGNRQKTGKDGEQKAIYFSFVDDFANNTAYYLLTVMSWGIYLIRRGLSNRLGNKKQ